jgi:hypothetical protein
MKILPPFSIHYYGNYCGPGWSDGKYQTSVVGTTPAIDEFDETCKAHDAAYALGQNPQRADATFIKQNFGKGLVRTTAAAAVAVQWAYRALESLPLISNMTKQNLRSTSTPKPVASQPKRTSTKPNDLTVANVPAATGYQLGAFKPLVKRVGNAISIRGREFGCSVNVINSASFGVSGMVPLTPALFQSATLGAHAKCHEQYRFTSIVAHYIPAVPTSAQGQVMLLSSKNLNSPFINSAASTFLARGLTQDNAILTPIWMGCSTEISCDNAWRHVDFFSEVDFDDNILEEIQVYGWSDISLQAGSIIIDFVVEFRSPIYQPHSANIPDALGPCTFAICNDDTAVNAANDAFILTNSTITAYANGSVFRMVFRQGGSALPTGIATWPGLVQVGTTTALTGGTSSSTNSALSMAEGTTLYGVVVGSSLVMYNTLQAARVGTSGELIYAGATTAKGVYLFMVHLVSIGNALVVTTQ